MITLADAVPGDEDAIAVLCAELDGFYGDTPEGTPADRAMIVRDTLFSASRSRSLSSPGTAGPSQGSPPTPTCGPQRD